MPNYKAPYCYAPKSPGGAWIFERNGYRTRLPRSRAEPWYSPDYALAMLQSGLRPKQVLYVLQQLPCSLAAAVHGYRLSRRFAAGYQQVIDDAAERLCDLFGWADLRALGEVDVRRMLPEGWGAKATLTVLRAVLRYACAAGLVADNPASRVVVPSRARCSEAAPVISDGDITKLFRVLPRQSPERVAVALMIHTGEDLKGAMRISPDDPRAGRLLWRHPALQEELPPSGDAAQPYVRQPGCKSITRSDVARRLARAADEVGIPGPSRATLRALHCERVADVIAGAV